jgi:hypothetical protein
MDKTNFTNNEIPTVADYNNINIKSETGIEKLVLAIASSTTNHVLFKRLFPTTSTTVIPGNFTLTASWVEAVGVAVNGKPNVIAIGAQTSALIPLPVATVNVDVRIRRSLSNITENRDFLSSTGVLSTAAATVGIDETFSVEVVPSTTSWTDEYFVWTTLVVDNTGAIVTQTDSTGYVVGWL